ncbi:unnamed protein product [Acanthoscelides obtectus]|uniref:Uncharacterized protein n=1 Tax=Acanthoscelides obtectus TaxID=200917 RepID=A0A9P0L4G9_ACAOB|nr:unnamed protein product [Acanthoscelides obtectus]CAK1633046.1 hypothetical protein AOBTE_LOCUS7902 [Acanthoscelides obtectus]
MKSGNVERLLGVWCGCTPKIVLLLCYKKIISLPGVCTIITHYCSDFYTAAECQRHGHCGQKRASTQHYWP